MADRYQEELKAFGLRLRSTRKRLGITQLDLELKTQIDRSDISKIERGEVNISFATIVKIAEALGVKTMELLS